MMINLKQAKQLIGMPVLAPMVGKIVITKVKKISTGKILVYNKFGWCCDINIIRNMNRQKFVFDETEKLEKGDSK